MNGTIFGTKHFKANDIYLALPLSLLISFIFHWIEINFTKLWVNLSQILKYHINIEDIWMQRFRPVHHQSPGSDLPLHLSPSYHYPLTGILQQSVKLLSLHLFRHLQSSLNTMANVTFLKIRSCQFSWSALQVLFIALKIRSKFLTMMYEGPHDPVFPFPCPSFIHL